MVSLKLATENFIRDFLPILESFFKRVGCTPFRTKGDSISLRLLQK